VASLTCEQRETIVLPWYHFVDIVRFTFDRGTDDRLALSTLLGAPVYDDAYEGPSGLGEGRHGPYLLERMTGESFDERTLGEVQSQIHEWLRVATELPDPDPADPSNSNLPADPTIGPRLNEHVFPALESADALYQLALPDTARGPEGYPVMQANGFHEFIAIDRVNGIMTLIVCSDD
jgi:hypothetical protein